MPGRLTLGLWNSYDARRFHEAHRRALARAAPLALAFDANLATFGFPYAALVAQEGKTAGKRHAPGERGWAEEAPPLRTPLDVARFVAGSTSIGEEGAFFVEVAEKGRFATFEFPKGGFPPQLGRAVLTTSKPDPARALAPRDVAAALARNESQLLVFGLGPHGIDKAGRAMCAADLDVTGRGASLETATAMGAVVAAVRYAAGAP